MCSTDTTYSSSDSSSFGIKRKSRIFSLFKFNGNKMGDLHRKFSEPNPAELLLYRKRSAPAIKLWTPDNTGVLRVRDDLNLEKLKRKSSVTDKFKRHKSRKGTVTSEDDDLNESSRRSSNTSTPLKRSHSFRESWNKLWHKKIPKYSNQNNDSLSSSGSEKSERKKGKDISAISNSSSDTTDSDKKNTNEVKINDNNDNFLSVAYDNVSKNFKRDKLSQSVNDLPTTAASLKPDNNNISLDTCQNSMVIKGHTRRRSWTNYFNSG